MFVPVANATDEQPVPEAAAVAEADAEKHRIMVEFRSMYMPNFWWWHYPPIWSVEPWRQDIGYEQRVAFSDVQQSGSSDAVEPARRKNEHENEDEDWNLYVDVKTQHQHEKEDEEPNLYIDANIHPLLYQFLHNVSDAEIDELTEIVLAHLEFERQDEATKSGWTNAQMCETLDELETRLQVLFDIRNRALEWWALKDEDLICQSKLKRVYKWMIHESYPEWLNIKTVERMKDRTKSDQYREQVGHSALERWKKGNLPSQMRD